jgi:protein-tyrosine phosphatase
VHHLAGELFKIQTGTFIVHIPYRGAGPAMSDHDFHAGEAPDQRAINAAAKRGYELSASVARKIELADFSDYDYILAMDWENLALLQRLCPRGLQHKLQLLMRFATEFEAATINDPYHGGPQGFEQALDYIEDACNGLMEVVRRRATMVAAA